MKTWARFSTIILLLLLVLLPSQLINKKTVTQASDIEIERIVINYEYSSDYFKENRFSKTGNQFDAGYSGFRILYKDKIIPFELFSIFVAPNEEVVFAPERPRLLSSLQLFSGDLPSKFFSDSGWVVTAPSEPGMYPIDFFDVNSQSFMRIKLFVTVPADQIVDGWLNGYRIGSYPDEPLNGNPAYNPPSGFIEVTPENMNTRISPHFTLGQFLCKQEGGFPKYMVLQDRLILQRESVLQISNQNGYNAPTFHIMSGYRTPWYNQNIGNGRYSRHIYGDAADIFIDFRQKNGRMDDLNKDGVIDIKDAIVLHEIIDGLQRTSKKHYHKGGLGLYGNRPWRGPFVHVDGRGHYARWQLN